MSPVALLRLAAARSKVERAAVPIVPRVDRGLERLELPAAHQGQRFVDELALSNTETDPEPLGTYVPLEDLVIEINVVSAKWGLTPHFEADDLMQILLRRERQAHLHVPT